MIRPYLRDLIDEHKPTVELNNNNNNNNIISNNSNNNKDNNSNSNNNSNGNSNSNNNRAEWEIQLTMQNSCISTKNLEDPCTIHTKSEPVEIYMGVTQKMSLIHFLIHFYEDFNMHKKHQMKEEANLFLIVLNYYIIIFKE